MEAKIRYFVFFFAVLFFAPAVYGQQETIYTIKGLANHKFYEDNYNWGTLRGTEAALIIDPKEGNRLIPTFGDLPSALKSNDEQFIALGFGNHKDLRSFTVSYEAAFAVYYTCSNTDTSVTLNMYYYSTKFQTRKSKLAKFLTLDDTIYYKDRYVNYRKALPGILSGPKNDQLIGTALIFDYDPIKYRVTLDTEPDDNLKLRELNLDLIARLRHIFGDVAVKHLFKQATKMCQPQA